MIKRISIYIDGANFVYGLKYLHPKYSDYHFDFENYIKMIIGKDNLVNIFYYNASLKQEVNPRRFKEQQKLLARLRKIPKCRVILCKRQKRFTKEDEEYYTIKGDDIYNSSCMLNKFGIICILDKTNWYIKKQANFIGRNINIKDY